jgi:hypothetical protein
MDTLISDTWYKITAVFIPNKGTDNIKERTENNILFIYFALSFVVMTPHEKK